MTSLDWVLIFIIVAALGAVLWVKIFRKVKYLFRIRLLTGTKKLVVDDIGVLWKDEKGVAYFKLKKMKELVPMPPQDAIDLSRTGKRLVECYRDERGNYAYIVDRGLNGFKEPIETNMKLVLADQIIKAHSKKKGWKEHIGIIVGLSFAIIMVLGGMMLIGEPLQAISKFTNQATAPILAYHEQESVILDKLIQLEQGIQTIKSQVGVPAVVTPPN